MVNKVTIFWFRRDLRLHDNAGLFHALKEKANVLPLFIFDTDILNNLKDSSDPRVTFIYQTVAELKHSLQSNQSDLLIRHGQPHKVFQEICQEYEIEAIYLNHDYEPSARKRDASIERWAKSNAIEFKTFKDQSLFEKDEILTESLKPYSVFTPYKNKALQKMNAYLKSFNNESYEKAYFKINNPEKIISLKEIGFNASTIEFPKKEISVQVLKNYANTRDIPALPHGTSHLGIHLRFGTISIRELAQKAQKHSDVFLSELLWRDFFMQILWHYPHVTTQSFKGVYDNISWRNSTQDFQRWAEGRTGYPLVDAGMRELQSTGQMHNRVRMVTASFLCKHLLIHWREGERLFAEKLLDFDLSANNGNWQWVAGSGCDAAPYFRIFNPMTQAKKFDPNSEYIKKWVPELNTSRYPSPIIEHNEARGRCLQAYSKVLKT
ncbi:MAG: cryptochrome/photolyase family protein [Pseudobdellovibrionaceae bacterium]